MKNFKINIHQNVSKAFNILHYKKDYLVYSFSFGEPEFYNH